MAEKVFTNEEKRLIRSHIDGQWRAQWEESKSPHKGGGPPKMTDEQLEQLCARAALANLNPLAGHIHAVLRQGRMTLTTSIDAFRLIANRTGEYAPGGDTVFEYDATDPQKLVSAKVFIKKFVRGTWFEYSGMARLDEYAQRFRAAGGGGWVMAPMWAKMPHNQLAKCAEALALRRGFPQELMGLYVEEEMHQSADDQPFPMRDMAEPAATRGMATLAQETITPGDANKGHGNEGKPVPVQDGPIDGGAALAPEVTAEQAKQERKQQMAADRARWEGIRRESSSIAGRVISADTKMGTKEPKRSFVIFTLETDTGAQRNFTCFDTRFSNTMLFEAKGHNVVVYYTENKKGNGAVYFNMTDLGELNGTPYWMGFPQIEGGLTDEDIPF